MTWVRSGLGLLENTRFMVTYYGRTDNETLGRRPSELEGGQVHNETGTIPPLPARRPSAAGDAPPNRLVL